MDKVMSMRVFSAVAKNDSFSAAAKKLSISKAMASKHVQNLESSLGVRLFNRTTRKLNLTDVGSAYYDKVDAILTDIDETELAISQLNSEPRGTLKIMAPPSFGAFHLSRALSVYLRKYPDVSTVIELSNRIPDLVEDGIDLAFYLGELDDSSFVARKIASTRHVICASPYYLKQNGTPQTPDDLAKHNCMIYAPRTVHNEWDFINNNVKIKVKISGDIQCNNGDALRIAAIQGCGIAQLPTYMVGLDIQSGRLNALLEEYEPDKLPIYAIYNHRKYLSAKIQTFIEFMYELYQPEAYWNEWA
ncbi:MAG TPA: LysR family transcriptional regulator [Thiotrichaceae bacterium]|jgi:DNA-binding transcriptional LysR family regulator|nr:LysR family transcriptional regulator [Thiotrichaceae bacterium]HIM07466.1 LysR family transcriptional regulator [Gammaproteobacteria bacterium]